MSASITAAQIKAIASCQGGRPRADLVAAIVAGWPQAVAKAKLTSRLRAAHFLGNIMTETGGLQILEESGAYHAERIMAIFGVGKHSAAVTAAEARRIAALPVASRGPVLFNRVYGVGNPKKAKEFDNHGPNDGWLYRGGGMMQATGKSNYRIMAQKTGLPLVEHPELLHQPGSAFTAAYLEWGQDGRCNRYADADNVAAARKVINGGNNGLAECRRYVAKAKEILADYAWTAPATFAAQADELEPLEAADPAIADPPAAVPSPAPAGADPELLAVQQRLKAMNYSPGIPTGAWGGMTAAAIAGFINDRGGHIAPPASLEQFDGVRREIEAELAAAEGEGFVRPVTPARASQDLKTVAEVAPEVLPARRSFLATLWAAIAAGFASIWETVQGWFAQAFDFFSDHDELRDPGLFETARSYLAEVPIAAWFALGAVLFAVLAFDAWRGVKRITQSVATGARQ